ncbi:MAG: universal stress protein [Gammaproteobacteria bacterium]|nr:MAG: universal stress protein [Gammaproteobacteria bacterium]
MSDYCHILLAVDFSGNTDAVAERALAISKMCSARISLVHVVEFVQIDLSSELVAPQELELDRELLATADQRLKELGEKYSIPDSERFVSQGSTKREILRIAQEQHVDLIVIGSHGREGIQLLLGSTANAVLHGAPCDVLAVRVRD